MIYHKSKQVGFIEHGEANIDKIMHDGECVFTQGFDSDASGTDSVALNGTIGKDLMDWSIVGNTYQASVPSPSSPVSVLGVGDYDVSIGKYKVPVVSRGKNLFDSNILLNTTGWVKNGDVYSGRNWALHSTFNSFDKCIPINANRVSVSLKFKNVSAATSFYVVFYYKDGTSSLGFVNGALNEWTILQRVSDADKKIKGIAFSYGTTGDVELKDIQVELGTNITEYEAYRQPTISTQYLSTPLMANERLTPQDKEIKWGKLVLTGNEDWRIESSYNFYCNTPVQNAKPVQLVKCTHFKSIVTYIERTGNCFISSTGKLNIQFYDFSNNLSGFIEWLKSEYDKGTPVTVWYQLATSTTEPVSTTPIGTLRNEEKTVKGTTTIITTNTEVLPAQIEAFYKSNKTDYVVVNFATTDGNIFTVANGDTYTIKMRKSQYDTMMTNELLNLLEVM